MTKEEIKEQIIERMKKRTSNLKSINVLDIQKIVNDIPETEYKSQVVEREILADSNKLFGKKVSDVISYLSLYKDCELHECWSGYEDNYFIFIKNDLETQDEIFNRLIEMIKSQCENLLKSKENIELLKKQKKELQNKIAEINKQLKL